MRAIRVREVRLSSLEFYCMAHRNGVSKKRSASQFRHNVGRAKAINYAMPMRGGIRL